MNRKMYEYGLRFFIGNTPVHWQHDRTLDIGGRLMSDNFSIDKLLTMLGKLQYKLTNQSQPVSLKDILNEMSIECVNEMYDVEFSPQYDTWVIQDAINAMKMIIECIEAYPQYSGDWN